MKSPVNRRLGLGLCTIAALMLTTLAARAADDPHAHHHHHAVDKTPGYARQTANYRIPEVNLVRADGQSVAFLKELDDGRPVVLNFIFTTCTAVCPVLSQSMVEFRRKLEKLDTDAPRPHLVSVSIDPEQDTPARLRAYAEKFGTDAAWNFYTGTTSTSVTLQKAFQAYFGDKMHHRPMTFMRAAPGQPWVRLEGFATPDDLLKEYRQLTVAQ
jgi:protein SCO1/2